MNLGVTFPQTELGGDVGAVRAYVDAVNGLGYGHISIFDHVLGADRSVHGEIPGPYDLDSTFHEPLVLFGYIAALCSLELVTSILILPQRQTALVAKQAAEVDLLTGGRFRLGVGLGWNAVEYEALGSNFHDRGARVEEQVGLLRRLWCERSVSFEGRFEHVTGAGIWPLPIQRPIPIWFGVGSDAALRRVGRIADGWFPRGGLESFATAKAIVDEAARAAGRDPAAIGFEPRVTIGPDLDAVCAEIEAWDKLGATHLSLNTMRFNSMSESYQGVDGHIAALASIADRLL